MTRTTRALQPLTTNIPPTPRRQAEHFKTAFEEKETENEELKSSVAALTKALGDLTIVKETAAAPDNPFNKKMHSTRLQAPKPATTAYRYYCQSVKEDLLKGNPDVSEKEINGMIRNAWKAVVGKDRKEFVVKAEKDKKRFEEENSVYLKKKEDKDKEDKALEMFYEKQKQDFVMKFYEAHVTAQSVKSEKKGKRKNKKDPNAPKKPLTSYLYFTMENRERVVAENPGKSMLEISKILGEEWGKLMKGKSGKNGTKKYDTLAAKDKARYESEKKSYDALKAKEEEQQLQQDKEEALKMFEQTTTAALEPELMEEETAADEEPATNEEPLVLSETETEQVVKSETVAKPRAKGRKKKNVPAAKSAKPSAKAKAEAPEEEYVTTRKPRKGKAKKAQKVEKASDETTSENDGSGVNKRPKRTVRSKAAKSVGPKKPLTSYFMFANEHRAAVKANMPEGSKHTDVSKALSAEWHSLSDEDKSKYVDLANKDKERYQKELEATK